MFSVVLANDLFEVKAVWLNSAYGEPELTSSRVDEFTIQLSTVPGPILPARHSLSRRWTK
jgi:hypothetical protein